MTKVKLYALFAFLAGLAVAMMVTVASEKNYGQIFDIVKVKTSVAYSATGGKTCLLTVYVRKQPRTTLVAEEVEYACGTLVINTNVRSSNLGWLQYSRKHRFTNLFISSLDKVQ